MKTVVDKAIDWAFLAFLVVATAVLAGGGGTLIWIAWQIVSRACAR